MHGPMLVLAGGCAAIGLLGPVWFRRGAGITGVAGMPIAEVRDVMAEPHGVLVAVVQGPVFLLVSRGLWIIRWKLLAGQVAQT